MFDVVINVIAAMALLAGAESMYYYLAKEDTVNQMKAYVFVAFAAFLFSV